MYQYHCLNAISDAGLEVFDENYTKVENMEDADAVLVRSAAMHDMELGENVKMKAAGGISSMEDAEKFLELGAGRLGTSRIVKIVKNEEAFGY